jgi:hypothetical protein
MTDQQNNSATDKGCVTCPHCQGVVPPILIWEDGDELLIRSPKLGKANYDWRQIPGRKFDMDNEANRVPKSEALAVYSLLHKYFDGYRGFRPDGEFVVSVSLIVEVAKAA